MDFVCERTRLSLSCIACIYSISKPQWHFKGITGRQPKHRASLFLVAVLAYLLSSFYSCPRADGSVTSDFLKALPKCWSETLDVLGQLPPF